MPHTRPARTSTRRNPTILVACLIVVAAIAGYAALSASSSRPASQRLGVLGSGRLALGEPPPGTASPSHREAVPANVWPADGQAAFIRSPRSTIHTGPNQHPAPIASVAKVMTAYLVLHDHPLEPGRDGPAITFTDTDVADTDRRAGRGESVVAIAAGERLTERQALQALLVPSANNVAVVLARWDAGSVERFVARMNETARSLGMNHTSYTDPSGYDDATVSTAADQVRIVDRAMRLSEFASIVAMPSATLPVAGTVRNTDALLGDDGFVGVKTGSDEAAGGCFAFRAIRWIDGRRTTITGVVLGQPGDDRVEAGLAAAAAMVDRIAGRREALDRGRQSPPPPGGA